uniref:Uncharacterized protein n=1 Tax=Moschus moschiferus TaxID=68415 RepID=A0A8C6DTC0_MOSMO
QKLLYILTPPLSLCNSSSVLCFPVHTPGSRSRLPPLLWKAFPPHDLIRVHPLLRPGLSTTHSSSTQAPLPRVGTIQSVFSSSESRWGPALGHESPSEMVWLRAVF